MGTFRIILGISIIAILVLMLFQLARWLKKKKAGKGDINYGKKAKHNYLVGLYILYRDNPLTKRYLYKIKRKVQNLYPADEFSIVERTSKLLLYNTITGIAGIMVTLFIARGDIYFICSGCLLTYFMVAGVTNASFIRMENKILIQLSDYLSSMRHKYHEVKIVEVAMLETLEDLPHEISLHIQNIYDILISSNMEYEIDQYVETNPNKYLLMLLSICSSVKKYGDKKLDDGSSLFLSNLAHLKDEVNNEKLTLRKKRNSFRGLTLIALLPVCFIKVIELFIRTYIPEIYDWYGSAYGKLLMVLIFVASFTIYSIIIMLRDGSPEAEKETDFFSRLASVPWISAFLNKVIYSRYTEFEEYNANMRALGDYTGPKALQLKRYVIAGVTFLFTTFVFFGTNLTQKYNYIHDWTNAFEDSVVFTDKYKAEMQKIGEEYTQAYLYLNHVDRDEFVEQVTQDIMEQTSVSRYIYANEVAKEIVSRIQLYHNSYFRFYYLLIAVALAAIGYQMPVWLLRFKKRIIEMRMQEEVVQFQSLMLILMYMEGITVAEILEWLERFSYCFREDISVCRMNLPYGEQKALIELREAQKYKPFSDFVDNLIAVDKVGVAQAFDSVREERQFNKDERREIVSESTQAKANISSLLVFIPLLLTILYIIIPMMIYANQMLGEMSQI